MAPKKPPNNGFFYLMQDHVESERRKGRNISMLIAQQEVGEVWKNMNKEQRQPYTERAARVKMGATREVAKLTSDGRRVSSLVEAERRKEDAKAWMLKDITSTLDKLQKGKGLETHIFHTIHANYYCETRDHIFYPAELAIVRFNLLDGEFGQSFHRIIALKEVPAGFRHECIKHSEQTHKLPLPRSDGDRIFLAQPVDERQVYDDLMDFLEDSKEDGKIPPLYVRAEDAEAVKSILTNMNDDDQADFRVYEVEHLLFHLKNKIVGEESKKAFPSITSAVEEVSRDVHCYVAGIACQFHNEHQDCQDNYRYCSLSIARRLMYLICDHTCHHLGIELIPGQHCHIKADTTGNTAQNLSRATSSYPSRFASGYTSRDPYEDDYEPSEEGFQPVVNRKMVRSRGRGLRLSDQ